MNCEIIRYKGGAGWYEDEETGLLLGELPPQPEAKREGVVSTVLEEPFEGLHLYRTRGEPTSIRTMFDDFGEHILDAADRFNIRPSFICACIAIEAVPGGKRPDGSRWRWNPRSCRYEDHINDSSPGLMQTLTGTANDMRKYLPELPRFDVGGRVRSTDDHPLFDPKWSILVGAAYARHEMYTIEDDEIGLPPNDPVLNMVAAYNAGSVRTGPNRWNLRTYSPTRIDRFLAWNNDALVVLEELGVWNGELPE